MSNLRVLVCGSRHFNDYKLLEKVLNEIHATTPIREIIEGEAKGADRLSVEWGVRNGVHISKFPANWDVYGKQAGPIRNYQMLKEGKPELVIAFIAPNSRGTKHMVEISRKAGIEVKEINIGD